MKIIFLEAVQDYGGARMSTLELAKRMQVQGHEVLIVDLWGLDFTFNQKVEELKLNYVVLDKRDNPFVIYNESKIQTIKNYISYVPHQLDYRMKFKVLSERFQPDIVSVNNIKCLSLLESNSFYSIDFFVRTWFAQVEVSFRAQLILKKYKPRFLTVSQSSRQAIYTSGLSKLENIKVLHSVIDEKVFYNFNPSYTKFDDDFPIRILHSGGFLPTKGQDIVIEIARSLREMGISFKLLLTGAVYTGRKSEEYYDYIVKLIYEYQLEDLVEISINESNMLRCFKNSDLLIHPSSTEGLPRVALEAMAFGMPVIANPVGGVTDVVINNFTGYITDFNNMEQYVSFISDYYYDLNLYIKHSQQCRNLIEQNYLDLNQNELIRNIYPL